MAFMSLATNKMVVRVASTIANSKTRFGRSVRDLIEARRRRIEHERKFYRELRAYCRTNNLSPICEDDWRLAAADRDDNDHSMIDSKGDVS
jgi:hypothetical protein